MARVLIATDAPWVRAEVCAVLRRDDEATVVETGRAVLPTVRENLFDLVVLDLQIGSMGGMATCMELRLEESAGRLPHVPVLMLLDRRPDVFLARRAGSDGWVVKPLDAIRLRQAVNALLDGGVYEDDSYRPKDSDVTAAAT